MLGTFTAGVSLLECPDNQVKSEFVVFDGKGASLLGKETAQKLGVLKVGLSHKLIGSVDEPKKSMMKPELKEEFKGLYLGLGKLKDKKVKLHVKPNVKPVVQTARGIPFSLRPKVEKKIAELEELDIIKRAEGPTSFVSPIVVVPKPNRDDIRLCIDMHQANQAVERERFPMPTVEETLTEMNGARVFSKLDLNMGFHQIELDEDSRPITTFATHIGLFRYKRLMFGVASAPEIYQHTIQNLLCNCEGARNMTDDIIIYADSVEEHDKRLDKVLSTLQKAGLTLNKQKCVYRMTQLQFMGFLLSEKGVGPTETKIEAVRKAERPTVASEVRSFLGLVNFSARFIDNLATKSEPLRKLTRKNVPFEWTDTQEKSFNLLKEEMTKAETLGYFDPRATETRIVADAGPVGLGAVLLQTQNGEKRAIYYASRSLSDVERRYSQTEKEALALVWACERFHMYVFGIKFVLETDHRPLQFIYSEKSKPSARIERWVLRLQSYDYTVEYKPGPQNIADSLSRLMKKNDHSSERNVAEEYVYFAAEKAV